MPVNNPGEMMNCSIVIKDYMLAKPVTISPDMSISKAAELIVKNKISGVVVVDQNDSVVGMLSEMDCLKAMISGAYNESGSDFSKPVSEFMTKEVITNSQNEDIIKVASSMLKHGHRRRPVVENGVLIGQVSCRQLLKAIDCFTGGK